MINPNEQPMQAKPSRTRIGTLSIPPTASLRPAFGSGEDWNSGDSFPILGWCTIGVKKARERVPGLLLYRVLPAKRRISGVDPTRLELVTSAMRRRLHSVAVVYRCLKIPANEQIFWTTCFQLFVGICSGNCQATVKSLSEQSATKLSHFME
jgi:hypothetical protein